MSEEGKTESKHKVYKYYKVNGEAVERLNEACPKCGPGTFMANHKDRKTCGKCGFSQLNSAETQGNDVSGAQKPKVSSESKDEAPKEKPKSEKPKEEKKPEAKEDKKEVPKVEESKEEPKKESAPEEKKEEVAEEKPKAE